MAAAAGAHRAPAGTEPGVQVDSSVITHLTGAVAEWRPGRGWRYEGDRLSYVDQTTALSAQAAADVAQMFGLWRITVAPPVWPLPLPARWVGFHQDKPLAYLPVTPRLTVEVVADTALEYGRYPHPLRFLRVRPDVT